ncbi:MAG TPA: hypothetical protein DEQ38_01515 [Elusimicrobia bacterium]|nr:MAG: hypothetical protein A2089_10100 [Elusimicrobia bacterium GWD2_63_28]HCC46786.1 hypothetical protein [Elusimicrobiota bacterium]
MNFSRFWIWLIPAAAGALLLLCATASGADNAYARLSNSIAEAAKAGGVEKLAVLDFSAKAGTERGEAEYVSEKIASGLAGRKRPALIERSALETLIKEARRASAVSGADADKAALRELFAVDAVVTGSVFSAGSRLKIIAKLIEVETGRVLLSREEEAEREWPQFSEMWDLDLPEFAPAGRGAPLKLSDLRDAIADNKELSCGERWKQAGEKNSRLLDAKARYWAGRMKEPGFSISGLTRNPGTEIADRGLKSKFYRLLSGYHGEEGSPRQEAAEREEVLDLLNTEKKLMDECGIP